MLLYLLRTIKLQRLCEKIDNLLNRAARSADSQNGRGDEVRSGVQSASGGVCEAPIRTA